MADYIVNGRVIKLLNDLFGEMETVVKENEPVGTAYHDLCWEDKRVRQALYRQALVFEEKILEIQKLIRERL